MLARQRLCCENAFEQYFTTEKGAAFPDELRHGLVQDDPRVSYYDRHLRQVGRILQADIPLSGYFAWLLMDNFEWSYGFTKRFGLIYVDFETAQRIPKASFHWYQRLIKSRTL